jgi:hypothetical protein
MFFDSVPLKAWPPLSLAGLKGDPGKRNEARCIVACCPA